MNGIQWKYAVISAANNLGNHKKTIDNLNVFPVPDGDTGTNMFATINVAKEFLETMPDNELENLSYASNLVAQQMLLGARGNSGVILSQIFRGFANAFKNLKSANTNNLIDAFNEATNIAYKAVLKPIEGTILTVIRETSQSLSTNVLASASVKDVFAKAFISSNDSVEKTPNLLPILKEVGVVDSGGFGLVKVIEGMSLYFQNQPVEIVDTDEYINRFINDTEVFEGEFGYCTEFIIDLNKPNKFDREYLVKKLEKLGSSIVVVHDNNFLKVHIHALKPGTVLNSVQTLGEFAKIKIENMTQQANNSKQNTSKLKEQQKTTDNKEDANNQIVNVNCGLITCNSGEGIINMVKSLGAHFIIEGGQTNNPSTADIVSAINKINAKTIFILPNNSNITLSAQQASQISGKKKNVVIIPTKTQVEGISALLNFNEDSSPEDNELNMKDAVKSIKSAEVTYAVKDTRINGVRIKKGQYLSLTKGKVLSTHTNQNDAAKALFDELIDDTSEIVTIYYGQDASEADAYELQEYIQVNFDVEVEINNGGQALYPYYIAIE
ncbi:DAK2 domain-containing protein [Mycoplasma miroungirhinis]|uniref:DAK2 domain-containing protein n=1 Tax=Mycoplasma miroungirhinis TaxID=754516 RepID=A0A6M4JBN0_9MOLU|nr:DAK2 domain-containing protein [Mycoplasma miroungirhinis]QJR44364.1 DAK2 domain-containing protein [Mycoplasma miroungirhinis]